MKLPEFEMTVTAAETENRSFRDRQTGQMRSFIAVSLAGYSTESGCLFSLSYREALAPRVQTLKVGSKVRFTLRSYEAGKGIVEGQVAEIL